MVNLFFLLLVLSSSLAVPQKAGEIRSPIGISVATGAALDITTTTVRPSTTTWEILTIYSKGYTTTPKGFTTTAKGFTTSAKGFTTTAGGLTSTTGWVTTAVSSPPKPTTTQRGVWAPAEIDCSDSSWVPTVDAWMAEDVDRKLKEWWESVPDRTSKNFVSEFGGAFGDFAHNLACGVDTEDQCVNPSCKGLFCILLLSPILGSLL